MYKNKISSDIQQRLSDKVGEGLENLFTLLLDSNGDILDYEHIASGSADTIVINPIEIFKSISKMSVNNNEIEGKKAVLCHNHPSGNPMPSFNDIKSTERLVSYNWTSEVDIADHIIITEDSSLSMNEYHPWIFR